MLSVSLRRAKPVPDRPHGSKGADTFRHEKIAQFRFNTFIFKKTRNAKINALEVSSLPHAQLPVPSCVIIIFTGLTAPFS